MVHSLSFLPCAARYRSRFPPGTPFMRARLDGHSGRTQFAPTHPAPNIYPVGADSISARNGLSTMDNSGIFRNTILIIVGAGAFDGPCRPILRFRIGFRQIPAAFCRTVRRPVPTIPPPIFPRRGGSHIRPQTDTVQHPPPVIPSAAEKSVSLSHAHSLCIVVNFLILNYLSDRYSGRPLAAPTCFSARL